MTKKMNPPKRKRRKIEVRAASACGAAHAAKGAGCQDHFKHYACGSRFVGVISDGAGSAKFGKIGAKIACETIVDLLARAPSGQAKARLKQAVGTAREKAVRHRFNKAKDESGLNDFAATIVGVFCFGRRGFFFHIGDGAAVALRDGESLEKAVVSRPENGEFACETFFYTMDDWALKMRFCEFSGAAAVMLMSDGLTGFALSADGLRPEPGFVLPIHKFLSGEKSARRAAKMLANTIDSNKARRLNSDDKTLLWARL